jgi:hypothetical protein
LCYAIGLGAAAVLNHVDLEEAWRRIAPVGKRPHRNTAPNRSTDTGSTFALPVDLLARGPQGSINRRRTHAQQLGHHDGIELEVTMPPHGIHQRR